jgi:hypothetical protein
MAITVSEKLESRLIVKGLNPSATFLYDIFCEAEDDELAVMAALEAEAPLTYDIWGSGILALPRGDVRLTERLSDTHWVGRVEYALTSEQSQYAFETGGGTQHITNSLLTVNKYPPATAPDFAGAIGVTENGVEGVDITVPVYQFAETHFIADELVTPAYKATVAYLTGRTNVAAFKGFAIGEVLFLGAAGQRRGNGNWEICFRFAASPNVVNLTIGSITGIAKAGWDYLWVRYLDKEDTVAKAMVKQPLAVYVERVYQPGDLSLLGIGV